MKNMNYGDLDSLYDYELLTQMVTFASHRIVLHPILDELRAAKTPFRLLRSAQHTPVVAIDNSALVTSWSHSSLLILPEMSAGSMDMKLHVQGRAKTVMNLPSNDSIDFDASTGIYKLTLEGANTPGFSLVNKLKERLQQIEQIVSYIELIKDLGLELVTASMQQIKFKLGDAQVSVDIPSELNPNITLHLSPTDPHNIIHSYLQETLNSSGLRPVVWLLQTTRNLYTTLQKLQKTRGGDPTVVLLSLLWKWPLLADAVSLLMSLVKMLFLLTSTRSWVLSSRWLTPTLPSLLPS